MDITRMVLLILRLICKSAQRFEKMDTTYWDTNAYFGIKEGADHTEQQ
jgi:hypothetical protein